jgi:hypothetical protein
LRSVIPVQHRLATIDRADRRRITSSPRIAFDRLLDATRRSWNERLAKSKR